MDSKSDGYLVICSYAIAILELLSAMLFASVSTKLYVEHKHWTSLICLIFSIIWVAIIIILFLGIYMRRLAFIRYWLVVTCLGIMLDALLLLYGLTLAITINWEGMKVTVMPFVGLAVEMTFVYIVYLLYLDTIEKEQWLPVRNSAGCSQMDVEDDPSNSDTVRKEQLRLNRIYRRQVKAARKQLQRKMKWGTKFARLPPA